MIRGKLREWWRFFSLIIIPLGMTLYSPIATFIDRLDGVSAAAGISFWEDLEEHHFVSLLFGLTFLIVFGIGFFGVDRYELVQLSRVNTGGKGIAPEKVDAEANDPASEWLPNLRVILGPEMIIGYTNGVTAVRYEDIKALKLKTLKKRVRVRLGKWVEKDAIGLHPSGNVSEFLITESIEDPELVWMEIDIIREKCQEFHPDIEVTIMKDGRKVKGKGKCMKAN